MPENEEERNQTLKFAMKLIGLRRRSVFEIDKRMKEKNYGKEVREEVIQELFRFGYLDDEQFAESYINDRINFRPAGRFLIKMELKKRGINDKIIEEKLNELLDREKEIKLAEKLTRKRIDGLDPANSQKDRIKLGNYLKARGFSGEIISQAIKNALK